MMVGHSRSRGAKFLITCLIGLLTVAVANLNHFQCDTLGTEEAVVDGGLDMVQGFMSELGEAAVFDDECLNIVVKKNYFETAEYLLKEYYSKDPQRGAQAESTTRNAVQQIRNQQNDLLGLFEELVPRDIPVISPAFRWAQSVNETYLELKYSTRLDSPFACTELFDEVHQFSNNGTSLYIAAMCRSDKKLLKYELNVTLAGQVNETQSYFVDQGVGRLFVNMTKVEQPSRWKSFLGEGQEKLRNQNLWWEMYEKHEKELDALVSEDDMEEEEELVEEEGEESAEPKKKRKKKKQKKVGKKSKQAKQEESDREVNEEL